MGKCIKLVKDPKTFTEAEVGCAKDQGRLVSIKSCQEFTGLATHLWNRYPDITNKYWFGMYLNGLLQYKQRKPSDENMGSAGFQTVGPAGTNDCLNYNDKVQMTVDGTTAITSLPITYHGFHGQLKYNADKTPKVMLYEFGMKDSTMPSNYLCEKELAVVCPNGYFLFQSLCYKFNQVQVTQSEAERLCIEEGAKLLELQATMQQTFILAAFQAPAYGHTKIWLNYQKNTFPVVHYRGEYGIFDFQNGLKYTGNNTGNTAEFCVYMDSLDTVPNSWKMGSCHENASFICEKSPELSPNLKKNIQRPQVLMPFDEATGFKDLAYTERVNNNNLVAITNEGNLNSGLIGAAHFQGYPLSYIDIENIGTNKQMRSSFGISISMWVYVEQMFDDEKQFLIDARNNCSDIEPITYGFFMFLSKIPDNETTALYSPALNCSQIYDLSKSQTPKSGEDPSKKIRAIVQLCSTQADKSVLCRRFSSSTSKPLKAEKWHHIGFTYNDVEKQGTFFIDDSYGYTDMTDSKNYEYSYFSFDSNGWWSKAFNSLIRIGSKKFQAQAGQDNFVGKISCLQMYEGPLEWNQFNYLSKCPVPITHPTAKLCPPGYDYYAKQCYMISSTALDFAAAEASCISPPGNKYKNICIFVSKK